MPRERGERTRWRLTTSAVAQQFGLGNQPRAARFGGFLGQVLAPGDHIHAERLAIAPDDCAQPTQPDNAKRLAGQRNAEAHLLMPATSANALVCARQIPCNGEDQRESEFGRWRASPDRPPCCTP